MFEKEKAAPSSTAKKYFLFYEIHWINKYGISANGENALTVRNEKAHTNIPVCAWQSSQHTNTWKKKKKKSTNGNQIFEWETDSMENNVHKCVQVTRMKAAKNDVKHTESSQFKADFPPDLRTETMKNRKQTHPYEYR